MVRSRHAEFPANSGEAGDPSTLRGESPPAGGVARQPRARQLTPQANTMTSRRPIDHDAPHRRTRLRGGATTTIALPLLAIAAATPITSSAQKSNGQLNSSLGATQARAGSLSASISSLDRLIASLGAQISLVQSREAAASAALAADRVRLASAQQALDREQ